MNSSPQTTPSIARRAVGWGFWLLLALPVSIIGTWVLMPFWNWFESRLGVEAVGHMGPATWCYGSSYGLIVLSGILIRKARGSPRARSM